MSLEMRLHDKILNMRREVGHTPMLCIITQCEDICKRSKSTFKPYEIPYVMIIKGELKQYSICLKKVEEYWSK